MIKKLIKFFKRTSFYKFWLYTWPKRQYTKWFRKLPINEKAILLEAQHGTEINGNIVSGLTVILKKAFGKYNYAVSFGGPVCDIYDTNLIDMLVKELEQYFKQNNVIFIKFNIDSIYTEKLEQLYKNQKYKVLRKNTIKYKLEKPLERLLIDLTSKDYDEALEELSDKVKSNLDNAIRKKMLVKVSSTKRELNIFLDNYK